MHRHRDVQGGAARAAVFGVSDGLVSNVALILGIAGASTDAAFVRVAGVSGLLAGAVSMAAGEYVSLKAQAELVERELEIERISIAENPEAETAELAAIYVERGLDPNQARVVAAEIMADPDVALDVHAREELGVNPNQLGSPLAAAMASFWAFAVGAFVPLVPWLVGSGTSALWASASVRRPPLAACWPDSPNAPWCVPWCVRFWWLVGRVSPPTSSVDFSGCQWTELGPIKFGKAGVGGHPRGFGGPRRWDVGRRRGAPGRATRRIPRSARCDR